MGSEILNIPSRRVCHIYNSVTPASERHARRSPNDNGRCDGSSASDPGAHSRSKFGVLSAILVCLSKFQPFICASSVGHMGRFGHEFLEFEFRPDGKLRYANNSHYKKENIIRKEVYVTDAVLDELRKIIEDSEIVKSVAYWS